GRSSGRCSVPSGRCMILLRHHKRRWSRGLRHSQATQTSELRYSGTGRRRQAPLGIARRQEREGIVKYWLFRSAAAVVPLVPMRLARPLFTAIGVLAWFFAGEARSRVERNLRHIPALAINAGRLQQASRGVFITSALNYLDFLRGRRLT